MPSKARLMQVLSSIGPAVRLYIFLYCSVEDFGVAALKIHQNGGCMIQAAMVRVDLYRWKIKFDMTANCY